MYKMQSLEVSGAVRPLEWSLGVKGLIDLSQTPDLERTKVTSLLPVVNT